MAIPIETFFLEPNSLGTLQSRIQQMIANGILSGRFLHGEKLPSTRRLAAHLGPVQVFQVRREAEQGDAGHQRTPSHL